MTVLAELLSKYEARQRELDELLAAVEADGGRDLTSEEEAKVAELVEKRDKHLARIEEENATAKRQNLLVEARRNAGLNVEVRADGRGADMSVESEEKVYGVGSANSFFADLYYTATGFGHDPLSPQYRQAMDRRYEWSHQVEVEMSDGTKFGRFAEKQFREYYRSPQGTQEGPGKGPDYRSLIREARSRGKVALSDKTGLAEQGIPGVESRALTTGGGTTASAAGGGIAAFVTPIFTEGDYVPFREFGRAFADECTKRPLPAYGMTIYMPQITSGATVATNYTEGSAAEDSGDPAQGFITAGLIITAGAVTTSQASLDRAGPNFEYDVVIWDQLERDYAQKWDVYVLTQALANALSQSYTGTFKVAAAAGVGGAYGQVGLAKATIRTTAGTVLNPNRVFFTPTRWEYIAGWGDTQGRPIVVPDYAGVFNAAAAGSATGDAGIEGPTGYRFNGLPAIADQNIPLTGGTANQDQMLVADTTQTWAYEGAPVHRVLPQTLAGNLQVVFQHYSYGTVLQRYNDALVKINGTALAAAGMTFNS